MLPPFRPTATDGGRQHRLRASPPSALTVPAHPPAVAAAAPPPWTARMPAVGVATALAAASAGGFRRASAGWMHRRCPASCRGRGVVVASGAVASWLPTPRLHLNRLAWTRVWGHCCLWQRRSRHRWVLPAARCFRWGFACRLDTPRRHQPASRSSVVVLRVECVMVPAK